MFITAVYLFSVISRFLSCPVPAATPLPRNGVVCFALFSERRIPSRDFSLHACTDITFVRRPSCYIVVSFGVYIVFPPTRIPVGGQVLFSILFHVTSDLSAGFKSQPVCIPSSACGSLLLSTFFCSLLIWRSIEDGLSCPVRRELFRHSLFVTTVVLVASSGVYGDKFHMSRTLGGVTRTTLFPQVPIDPRA